MTTQNVAYVPAEQRITLCNTVVPTAGQGPSLQEIASADLPDGALAFVVSHNAQYRLKKASTATVDANAAFANVVLAANGGRWVRVQQMTIVALSAGLATVVDHFDLTGTVVVLVNALSLNGTPGFLSGVKTNATTVTVNSNSNTDTSTVFVQVIESVIA